MHQSFNLPGLNVIYAEKPYFYRSAEAGETEEAYCNRLIADLENLIQAEGADTIGAMIAEPIIGAGGVRDTTGRLFPLYSRTSCPPWYPSARRRSCLWLRAQWTLVPIAKPMASYST